MTNIEWRDILVKRESHMNRGDNMAWAEMSYRKYTQTSNNPEPEIWDEIYEPTLDELIQWIMGRDKDD